MSDTITVTWKTDSKDYTLAVPLGLTLMEAARDAGVQGIIGECGGALACATCHVMVVSTPAGLDPKTEVEADMLDFSMTPATDASRLSCQLVATPDLDGMVLAVPEA